MREHDQEAGQTPRRLDRLTGAILDGRYRIDAKLAAGGFGSIYKATDLVMGRNVALKVLHRELTGDPSVVARFRREAAALARLRDPHTITMYDVGEAEDGTLYIVLELLRGESLFELYERTRRLPWRRVAAIARGVCSSLREAHSFGIIHRDLKPANIFLEQHALEEDFVKVLDFGIAKIIEGSELEHRDLTIAGQMIGTFDYMPPEQLIGGLCDGRSDVFTLGVVIYEMIAGERPYGDAKGPATMLMTLLGTTPTPLAERARVPLALSHLVMRTLARDPRDRLDVGDLDDQLARILEAEEATFYAEDEDTWIEPKLERKTPVPARPTLIGPPVSVPRVPLPLPPPDVAIGSKTELEPIAARPSRMPSGTSPIVNKEQTDPIGRSFAREVVLRIVVYSVLAALIAATVYLAL